jgi:hypothetical protein
MNRQPSVWSAKVVAALLLALVSPGCADSRPQRTAPHAGQGGTAMDVETRVDAGSNRGEPDADEPERHGKPASCRHIGRLQQSCARKSRWLFGLADDLELKNNAALSSAHGLAGLTTTTDSLFVEGNTQLPQCEVDQLAARFPTAVPPASGTNGPPGMCTAW